MSDPKLNSQKVDPSEHTISQSSTTPTAEVDEAEEGGEAQEESEVTE
ncbi:MAG TPA: hypothetical protein VE642_08895 [Pyrinomonadaceae bacterium]|jgi:hypothetical protein|nr:hypothetical protein [Pyrinomonadaceae bacterium]